MRFFFLDIQTKLALPLTRTNATGAAHRLQEIFFLLSCSPPAGASNLELRTPECQHSCLKEIEFFFIQTLVSRQLRINVKKLKLGRFAWDNNVDIAKLNELSNAM